MHPPTPPAEKKTRGVQGEATTSNAHLLVAICSFIVGFVSFVVIIPFHAVVVNFINDRGPDATVQSCTCILGLLLDYLFITSHGAAYEFLCSFAPRLSLFPLSRGLGAGDPCCWGGERGSEVTYPSLVHAATVRHSISVLSFRLDELCLGHLHPNQIKKFREFV